MLDQLRDAFAALAILVMVAAGCSGDSEEAGRGEMQVISDECPIVEPSEAASVDAMIWQLPVTEVIGAELEECNSGTLSVTAVLLPVADSQQIIEAELEKDSSDVEIFSTTDGTVARNAAKFMDLSAYIDKYWEQFSLDDIPQPIWDAATVNGRILGVPLFTNTLHFFYNSEILAAHDIAPPDNYDELLVACEILRDAGFDDPFNMNVNYTGAREIEFSSILASLGGTLINDDNTPGWNTGTGLAAANRILAISETCMSDAGREFSIDDGEAAMRAGALPMARIWADRAAPMDDPEKSDAAGVIEFGPSLRTHAGSPRNAPAFIIYLSIAAHSTVDPDLVFQVIMAGADLESQNAAAAHSTVSRLSATHPDAPGNSEVVARSIAEGTGPRTNNPALDIAREAIGDAVLAIIQNGADPATELALAEAVYIERATEAGYLESAPGSDDDPVDSGGAVGSQQQAASELVAASEAEEMGMISEECPIPEPAEGVSVDVLGWEFPGSAQYAIEFEECRSGNLSVNVQLIASANGQDQVALNLSTGSPEFEVVQMTNSMVGAHADSLIDLAQFIEKYSEQFGLDDISEAMWGAGTVDGRILGVPVISNTRHLFYNEQILSENGVMPPTTFAEVIEACGVLRDVGFDDPFNMNVAVGWAVDIEFHDIIKSLDGDYLNADNSPAFNSPEGLAAVQHMVAIRDACMSDAGRKFSIDDAEAALRAGELPMASIWASRAAAMDDEENSLVVGQIQFAPALYTEGGSLRTGGAVVLLFSIPAGTSVDPEIVFQVIMAGTDLESQNAAAAHAAVSRTSASNPDGPRNSAALLQSIAEGVGAQGKNPALPLAQGAIGDELLEVLQNDANPATALVNAEARYIKEATAAGFM